MANYPCDFLPHLPAGVGCLPPNHLRPQRGYAVVGGTLPINCDDWAIIIVEPEPAAALFNGTAALIRHQLEHVRHYGIREITPSGMGAALVRFQDVIDRDSAIATSPYHIGETIMRVIA